MYQVKLVLMVSVLLQACTAYDIPPFTWKALEEAEKHASTAAASFYAESLKLQQAVKERVFTPEVPEVPSVQSCEPVWNPCSPHHRTFSHNVTVLLLTLLAIPAAVLLGWFGGVKQAESSQALQRARAADQAEVGTTEREEAARLAANAIQVPPINHTDQAHDRQPNQALHQGPQLQTEMRAAAGCAATNHWSSPDDSDNDVGNLQDDQCQQDNSSSQGSVDQPEGILEHQSRPVDGHAQEASAAVTSSLHGQLQQTADDDQNSTQPASSSLNVQPAQQPPPNSSQQTPALPLPRTHASSQQSAVMHASNGNRQLPSGGLQVTSALSEEAAALNTAFTVLEVVIKRLGIRPQELDQQQRVNLVSPVVQAIGVYLDLLNHKETHRLRGIANEQGAEHNEILREGQGETRAWRQTKEEQKQLQLFYERLADCLACGLFLMLGGMLYWGTTLGYFQGRLSECSSRRSGFLVNVWKPWQAVESLQTICCYIAATCDLTGSVLLMLGVPWFVKKHKLLSNSIAQPMTGLVLGLGAAGGIIGRFAVGRVGGDSTTWLIGYWLWIALHVLSVWFVQDLYRGLNQKPSGGSCRQFVGFAKLPLFYMCMAVIMPLTTAVCPFWKVLMQQQA